MADEKCNGWTNFETWCVKLWLDSDEGTYRNIRYMAEYAESVHDFSDMLSDFITDGIPIESGTMYSDLIENAISKVNCDEIAEAVFNELGLKYYKNSHDDYDDEE